MKRIIKITILIVALIASVIIGLYLYKNELQTYALIAAAVALVLFITLITYTVNTRSEEAIYNSTLKKVLNNYDAILVESHNFPDLKGKNIMKVTNMDDLVDAQIEIRKPIYYMIEGEDSCSFVLQLHRELNDLGVLADLAHVGYLHRLGLDEHGLALELLDHKLARSLAARTLDAVLPVANRHLVGRTPLNPHPGRKRRAHRVEPQRRRRAGGEKTAHGVSVGGLRCELLVG